MRARRDSDSTLTVGDLMLDEDSHEVSRDGEEISLTATEFELLRFLMRNPRRVLSKAQILDRVWNYDFGGQANVVELYISYLRKKIDAGREPMIHTMRGAGYVLKPAEPATPLTCGRLRTLTARLVLTAVLLVARRHRAHRGGLTAFAVHRQQVQQLDEKVLASNQRAGDGDRDNQPRPDGPPSYGPGVRAPGTLVAGSPPAARRSAAS